LKARLVWVLPIVAVLALLAFPAGASADPGGTTIVVTTTDDGTDLGCSLRNAILAADTDTAIADCAAGSSSSTDTIEVPAGQYDLSVGQLVISSDMNIVGAGARSTDIRGFAIGQRVFEVSSGTVSIGGVTIEGGSETSGSLGDNPGVGGGIWVDNPASLTLQDSMVSGNHADSSGGGIDVNGSLTVERSTIENNQAGCGVVSCPGFGIGGGIDDFGADVSITNSTIMGNQSASDGGGLYVGSEAGVTFANATIANNQADLGGGAELGGGGIAVAFGTDAQTVHVTNTLLSGNIWNGDNGNCSTGIHSLGGNLADDGTCGLGAGDQSSVDPQLGTDRKSVV